MTVFQKDLGSCPKCHAHIDAHEVAEHLRGNEDVAPQKGDVLLCWYCAAILYMVEDSKWEMILPEDLPNRFTFTECAVLLSCRNQLIVDIRLRQAALN